MPSKDLKDKIRGQSKGKFGLKNEFLLPKLDKIVAPLTTKSHYSFEEALQFIKAKFRNFTRENLLNHGFQGDVIFFMKVPLGLRINSSIISKYSSLQEITPNYLIISPLECEEIELNEVCYQNAFEKGCVYDESLGFLDALPNYDPNPYSSITPQWRTFRYYRIPITIKNLQVTHSELICLSQIIEFRLSVDNNQPDVSDKSFFKTIPKSLVSLTDASAGTLDCRPLDLLRRAIQRNLILFARVPAGISVRSSSASDYDSGVEYLPQPQFLAINALDCTEIYNNGSVFISNFHEGYIADYFGHLKRITPADERPELADENPSWRIYQDNELLSLDLTCQHLYAMQSDIAELLDQDECQDLKISKASMALLLQKDFVSLERAVELAKLTHPECTMNHLLRIGHQGRFNIITPIPVAIEVRKYAPGPSNNVAFNTSAEYPVFLELFRDTCLDIERYGKTEAYNFSSEYWIFDNQLQRKSVNSWSLATYYNDNSHEIELTPDRLFISRVELNLVINFKSNLWASISKLLVVESKERDANIPKMNAETLAENKDESSFIDSGNVNAKKDQNQLKTAKMAGMGVGEKNDQQRLSQKVEVLPESPSKSIKFLSRTEVMERLDVGKSKMYNCMDPNSKYFDSEFPKPIGDGSHKKSWVESEVQDYQELLMNRRSGSSRAD